jgi:2-dehydropantoate 2-reductase
MRIAVMGSGGIGGIVGGRLGAAGNEVLFIARGAHLEAMRRSGLRVLGELGDLSLPGVDATDDPSDRSPVDVVIFTVKGQDNPAAVALIAPLVGPDTAIVSFQNGIEGLDLLAERYPSHVLPGTTMMAATIEAPGVVRHFGTNNQLRIGEWDGGRTERAEAFREACAGAGLEVTISDDIHADVWSKFVAMATMSAVTCLTRLPVRTIVGIPETRQLVVDSMKEVMAVARARGVTLPADLPEKILGFVGTVDPTWKTSMCNDLEAGKVIELDTISGAIDRLGRQLGVPTPVQSVAYRALKYYTLGGPSSP